MCVCLGIQTGTYNKSNNRVPSWKKAPVCQTCTKHMRGVAKMLEYKQKRNNGRTPFAGVYKFVCVCVCVYVRTYVRTYVCTCSHMRSSFIDFRDGRFTEGLIN